MQEAMEKRFCYGVMVGLVGKIRGEIMEGKEKKSVSALKHKWRGTGRIGVIGILVLGISGAVL